jgi:hypothetical protein
MLTSLKRSLPVRISNRKRKGLKITDINIHIWNIKQESLIFKREEIASVGSVVHGYQP